MVLGQLINYFISSYLLITVAPPTILVSPLPKVAPSTFLDSVDTQVFHFSLREKNEDVSPIQSEMLQSSPSEWQVSLEERGTSLVSPGKQTVLFGQGGKLVATFKISTHGQHDVRIQMKTSVDVQMSSWGGGQTTPSNLHATVQVSNRNFVTPFSFLEKAGFSIFIIPKISEKQSREDGEPLLTGAKLPLYWTQSDPKTIDFYLGSGNADVYLSLTKTHRDFLKFFWGITGVPQVPPPIFALGFIASRWGWKDRNYISNILSTFDLHDIPIDSFVMDFEWYFNITGGDYLVPNDGLVNYPDFSYGNTVTFPDVPNQIQEYRARSLKFGGIRKPRLGNKAYLHEVRKKGWTLKKFGKDTKDLNFAIPELKVWYGQKTKELLENNLNAPDFFWNDEGETSYFTYHHWILAQQQAFNDIGINRRFSLNRAFTPGVQRLESFAVWTGDVPMTWESLKQNVGMLVRWSEAGAPLVTFDGGGFTGVQPKGYEEMLVRWYQLGIFAGVMRVHSKLADKPHFPFAELWGAEYAKAMKSAVHFRYSLIPTINTALHQMRLRGIPWIERVPGSPPDEVVDHFLCANGRLLVVPITTEFKISQTLQIKFPANSLWYPLHGGVPQSGAHILENLSLDDIPVYAMAGSIVLLHGTDITRAVEIIGGKSLLIVRIFPTSQDLQAIFQTELIEDDGQSLKYEARTTTFSFDSSSLTLSWTATESNIVPWYKQASVILHSLDGQILTRVVDLLTESSVTFKSTDIPISFF